MDDGNGGQIVTASKDTETRESSPTTGSYLLRVVLIVEVPFYREGLQRLLLQDGTITVVGAVCGDEAVVTVAREKPALVLLDISPSGARRWLDQLREIEQPPRVVALAVDESR